MKYDYRLKNELEIEKAKMGLKDKFPNRVYDGYPKITYSDEENNSLLDELKKYGIQTDCIKVDKDEYMEFIKKIDYKKKYPQYYSFNFHEKTLEHFIAFKLLDLQKDDNFVDIAAENSPHSHEFALLTGCNGYMHDIMLEDGVHGNTIGSDVSNIPVEDNFFQGALAACSIEHFEDEADINFMKEMSRILARAGKVIVIPLYLHEKPFIATDPKYSIPGNVAFNQDHDIHCVEAFANRHGRFYSAVTLYERLIKPNQNKMSFKVIYVENFKEIHKDNYCRFVFVGEKY